MNTNISSPTMWGNFLRSNSTLIAEELKTMGRASLPDMDELVSNPQFITTEIATILCEIQDCAKMAMPILPLFVGVMTEKQLSDTVAIMGGGIDVSIWYDWIRALGMIDNSPQLTKFWDAAPKEVKKWQRKCEPFYVDVLFDKTVEVLTPTPITDMVIKHKMTRSITIRIFGKRRIISEKLDKLGIRHECHESWGDEIALFQWHEKTTNKNGEWMSRIPSVTIHKDTNYKDVLESIKTTSI